MILHGLARVKNEGDVIEEFVRHNLQYLDALTVVDNVSLDGTVSVLEALRAEGLPLTILTDPTLPKRQYETMTRIARQSAAEADWDFLFLLCADEFLKVSDRSVLETSLAALPSGVNGQLPMLTYAPTVNDPAGEPRLLSRIRYRRAVEPPPRHEKCVLSRRFANGGAFTIAQGNHAVRDANGVASAELLADAALAHFPVRSLTQIQGKILLGWGAYLAMGYDAVGMGWHQRRLFERLESAPAWTDDDLHEIAVLYNDDVAAHGEFPATIYDPLEPVPDWRYGNAAGCSTIEIAARYVRQLAGALARSEAARSTEPTVPRDWY